MKRLMTLIASAAILAGASFSCQAPQDNSKAVIDNIMARRSIRKYQSEPVKRETMKTIIECGINAPSAMNKQAWEIRIIDNPSKRTQFLQALANSNPELSVENANDCFRNAPTIVVIANQTDFHSSQIDCGHLCENIMLSACALGVGSVCLGIPVPYINNSPEAKEMLDFSAGYKTIICIGLGYPDEAPDAKPRDISKVRYIED